jgi:hypothetical protein
MQGSTAAAVRRPLLGLAGCVCCVGLAVQRCMHGGVCSLTGWLALLFLPQHSSGHCMSNQRTLCRLGCSRTWTQRSPRHHVQLRRCSPLQSSSPAALHGPCRAADATWLTSAVWVTVTTATKATEHLLEVLLTTVDAAVLSYQHPTLVPKSSALYVHTKKAIMGSRLTYTWTYLAVPG